jgi:lysophospholipase L1-like esterase
LTVLGGFADTEGMRGRGTLRAAACVVFCVVMAAAVSACSTRPAAVSRSSASSFTLVRGHDAARGQPRVRPATGAGRRAGPGQFAACERRLEHSARPVLVVAGASFTAGTGPGDPRQSWAARLAGMLRWNAIIIGVPGAGYTGAGAGRQGPALRVLGREDLAAVRPALVILQFGHDDIGVPAAVERRRVTDTLRYVRLRAPRARIALITVFTAADAGPSLAAARRTDAVIVSAAAAFGGVIVMNPLARDWTFQRAERGGLHPSAAGDAQIAGLVADILGTDGVPSAPAAGPAPVICVSGIPVHPARPA